MLSRLDDHWFYHKTNPILKLLLIFVYGDIILLLPLLLIIFFTVFISKKLFLFLLFSYITIRGLGEMFYWIDRQYRGAFKYRPFDFGLKNLGNKAIYIIYQTGSIILTIIGLIGLYVTVFSI